MRRVNPRILAAVALGLLLLIAMVLMLANRGDEDQDKLSDDQAAGKASSAPASRCASQATYDRIKTELFRQAAQMRQNDQAVFDKLAAYASARVERPLLRSRDEDLGTLRCAGRLSIDLPPGVAVVGGRRTLAADIDYVLQPAADGSGDVVMLEGADPIIVPLATLARSGSGPALPNVVADQQEAKEPGAVAEAPLPTANEPAQEPKSEAEPPREVSNSARPSFNCRYARTKGEIAVCSNDRLANLDRQMSAQYFRAIATAGPGQRALLTKTRDSFLRYRDRCPSDACIAETYRGRMREIRDIMSGRWRPER